ncbi:RDD family protein [Pedosphaera parvula]|uniref:RDD domain containing protein n=1 Tax=Pedosphaera parvula (strain Ellin514) TaxID=320771 RepID=B9XGE6_PEDPL|nr:RDD family protein [Pedosphaera parvula]EEF60997.1 RDD domain containing protein [Pedosphaera parvula Ellin514]
MNWYYVDAGQQAGPVDDAGLNSLVTSGKITPDTLVWNESMSNWQPYSSIHPPGLRMESPPSAPPIVAAPPIAGNEVVCVECGGIFPADHTISYGNARVCAKCKPIFVQKLSEGVALNTGYGAISMHYAGFWIRAAAYIIDIIILSVVNVILNLVLGVGTAATTGAGHSANAASIVLTFVVLAAELAIGIGYEVFMIGKYGSTLGKMACRLQVVNPDGSKVSYAKAFGRYFGKILSGLTCSIGYIIAAFDDEKRALHDRICSTRVIHK